jgi:hypothetical protein
MGPRPLPSWDGIGVVHHGKSDTAMTAWGQKGHLDRRLAVSGLPPFSAQGMIQEQRFRAAAKVQKSAK